MTEKKKRGGGSELSRSATVTVRLDPKLRYLAGLAARKQRRTLSSFIEWSIEESLKHVTLGDYDLKGESKGSISDQAQKLWDVDEADRFIKLATNYPEMLTHHEQIVWKLVRESGFLWRGKTGKGGTWQWSIHHDSMKYDALRENWEKINQVAQGDLDKRDLPSWPGGPDGPETDDIPF